jgi:O-acetyl-ADP-ribose deacetylase (regulator of RNase III)
MPSTTTITARRADLTTLGVDAIVNAANSALAPGGGVCGAIHRAAGPELAEECATLTGCPTGDARITHGYRLPARHVIHAVGPRWQGGHRREAEQLASAYRRSLEIAEQHALRHVAFPAISTGIYGYPLDEATVVAVSAVRAFFTEAPRGIEEVIFACIDDRTLEAYRAAGIPVG